jgi:hypothetical protein
MVITKNQPIITIESHGNDNCSSIYTHTQIDKSHQLTPVITYKDSLSQAAVEHY